MPQQSRRGFLGGMGALLPFSASASAASFPLVDYHFHLTPSFSLDDAVALSRERGVKLGIAEHAGTKANPYKVILSSDAELREWIAKLDGKPVYKGVQAEWLEWTTCFSKDVVAELDYVLSDAMTMPGANGERTRMWIAGFDPGDPAEFMARYVKWNVEVIEKEPLDIFSHPGWLPAPLDAQFETLWTEERIKPVIAALKRTGTAIEIDSAYKIPSMRFLRMAKDAKLKFSFGSNSGAGAVRTIDFCVETAKALGLRREDMFVPAPRARKPILRRR